MVASLTVSLVVNFELAVSALEIRTEILIWHIYTNLAEGKYAVRVRDVTRALGTRLSFLWLNTFHLESTACFARRGRSLWSTR